MRSTSNVRKNRKQRESRKRKKSMPKRKIADGVNKSCSLVNMERGLVVVMVLGHVMMGITYIR